MPVVAAAAAAAAVAQAAVYHSVTNIAELLGYRRWYRHSSPTLTHTLSHADIPSLSPGLINPSSAPLHLSLRTRPSSRNTSIQRVHVCICLKIIAYCDQYAFFRFVFRF